MIPTTGDKLPPFRIESVSRDSMKAWANFLHDPNPIHLDAEVVKAKGLGEKEINQGPTNVAYIINMLNRAFPTGEIEELDSRFLDNVYADDTVTTFGTVTHVEQSGDSTRVTCDIGLEVEARGIVISGTTTIVLPSR
jgi:3-hydroxybutyryl-CoA dehydratase